MNSSGAKISQLYARKFNNHQKHLTIIYSDDCYTVGMIETFVVLLMRDTGEREIKNKASFRSFQKIKERSNISHYKICKTGTNLSLKK